MGKTGSNRGYFGEEDLSTKKNIKGSSSQRCEEAPKKTTKKILEASDPEFPLRSEKLYGYSRIPGDVYDSVRENTHKASDGFGWRFEEARRLQFRTEVSYACSYPKHAARGGKKSIQRPHRAPYTSYTSYLRADPPLPALYYKDHHWNNVGALDNMVDRPLYHQYHQRDILRLRDSEHQGGHAHWYPCSRLLCCDD
eukprot:gnl/Hemi2/17921_TR5911_c0_g1_i1.p1 gnl/Hemi2/17921_TR5911_c0_g1~~gnl/Hemi2/17921_TR5911_c0_g1_i1.p1  ORF type:complete len:196 (+),score=42.57 gnl/Hemi2/17921_TR5911_c0_g1_i1:100-687(+)